MKKMLNIVVLFIVLSLGYLGGYIYNLKRDLYSIVERQDGRILRLLTFRDRLMQFKDGVEMVRDKAGHLSRVATYDNGFIDGVAIGYYSNGIISDVITFEQGEPKGFWLMVDSNGTVIATGTNKHPFAHFVPRSDECYIDILYCVEPKFISELITNKPGSGTDNVDTRGVTEKKNSLNQ